MGQNLGLMILMKGKSLLYSDRLAWNNTGLYDHHLSPILPFFPKNRTVHSAGATARVRPGAPGSSNNQSMKDLSVSYFKARISACLREVQAGETIIITEHQRPVAEVRPYDQNGNLVVRCEKPFSLAGSEPATPSVGAWKATARLLRAVLRGPKYLVCCIGLYRPDGWMPLSPLKFGTTSHVFLLDYTR